MPNQINSSSWIQLFNLVIAFLIICLLPYCVFFCLCCQLLVKLKFVFFPKKKIQPVIKRQIVTPEMRAARAQYNRQRKAANNTDFTFEQYKAWQQFDRENRQFWINESIDYSFEQWQASKQFDQQKRPYWINDSPDN